MWTICLLMSCSITSERTSFFSSPGMTFVPDGLISLVLNSIAKWLFGLSFILDGLTIYMILNPTHSYSPPRLKFALRAYLTCFSWLISTCFVLFPLTQQYLIYQLNKFFVSPDNERKQLDKWIYPLVHSGSPSSFPKLISIHNELTRHCLCKATPLHMGTFVLIASSRDVVAGKTNHDQRTPCHGASHYCWFPSMELGC